MDAPMDPRWPEQMRLQEEWEREQRERMREQAMRHYQMTRQEQQR